MATLVSIATLQDCSDQLSSCCAGEVFVRTLSVVLKIFSSTHSSPFHPLLILLLFLVFFPPPFRWPTCYCQRWLISKRFSFTLLASIRVQSTHQLASFPGPTQLSVAFSSARDKKVGVAWDWGYIAHKYYWTLHVLYLPYTPRGRGVVVNISAASDRPLQLLSTYSATKVV